MKDKQQVDVEQKPSKEEYIQYMKENIEVHEYRAKLQKLQTQIAVDRAEELKAMMFLAQVTQSSAEDNPEVSSSKTSENKH